MKALIGLLAGLLLSGCATLGLTPEQAKEFRVNMKAVAFSATGLDRNYDKAVAAAEKLNLDNADELKANLGTVRTRLKSLFAGDAEVALLEAAELQITRQVAKQYYVDARDSIAPVFEQLELADRLLLERFDRDAVRLDASAEKLLSPGGGSDATSVVSDLFDLLGLIAKVAVAAAAVQPQ